MKTSVVHSAVEEPKYFGQEHTALKNSQYSGYSPSQQNQLFQSSSILLQRSQVSNCLLENELPPVNQPLITQYRTQKQSRQSLLNVNPEEATGFNLIDFFCGTTLSKKSVSFCGQQCRKREPYGMCSFMLDLLEAKYPDWEQNKRFQDTYEQYCRKNIPIFLNHEEISHRLECRFKTAGIDLPEVHQDLLCRVIRNYLKHCIHYKKHKEKAQQNDVYFWGIVGIYYHVGVPEYLNTAKALPTDSVSIHEPIMFWLLDLLMESLGDMSESSIAYQAFKLTSVAEKQFIRDYNVLLFQFGIPVNEILKEWMAEMLFGDIDVKFHDYHISMLIKEGPSFAIKTVLSYFEQRTQRLHRDELLSANSNIPPLEQKELILRSLLSRVEDKWPGVFINVGQFEL